MSVDINIQISEKVVNSIFRKNRNSMTLLNFLWNRVSMNKSRFPGNLPVNSTNTIFNLKDLRSVSFTGNGSAVT